MESNSPSKFSAELEVAQQTALAGAAIVQQYFSKGVKMRAKESYNLVSDADVESEAIIASGIRKHFPDHSILGEETFKDSTEAEHLWIIDPLDGTNNFAHGIPHFAISIAYVHNGVAQIGVVLNPVSNDLYLAERGKGAKHNGVLARVAPERSLADAMISFGVYYDRGLMMEKTLACLQELYGKNIHGARRMGTASLDLCMVGTGAFSAHFEYKLEPWDFAAGALFVEEAGGRVTKSDGNPLEHCTSGVLATNGFLHQELGQIVAGFQP